jgi:hypothetical protein
LLLSSVSARIDAKLASIEAQTLHDGLRGLPRACSQRPNAPGFRLERGSMSAPYRWHATCFEVARGIVFTMMPHEERAHAVDWVIARLGGNWAGLRKGPSAIRSGYRERIQ